MKIKKRFFININIIIVFFIFNCFSVYAVGLGPAKTEINFQPNLEFSVDYIAVDVPPEQKLEVYAKGDLVEYVEFDKKNLTGEENFKVVIKLPSFIEKPGPNKLYIGVIESLEEKVGISSRVGVEALILIHVPYPGKYAEISLSTHNVNLGENVNFIVKVNNLGKEDITAKTNIEIYSWEEIVETLELGEKYIKTQAIGEFEKKLNTTNYKAGNYKAIAIVDYGKIAKAEEEFKIGSLFVNITNYTSEFIKGKINLFEIEIESFWNSQINNIYAEVNVTENVDSEKSVDFFKTPSVSLKPWTKEILKGYFNAEELKTGDYNANITLYYEETTTEKSVKIKIVKPKTIIIFVVIIVIIIAVLFTIYLVWRRYGIKITKKEKKQEKK